MAGGDRWTRAFEREIRWGPYREVVRLGGGVSSLSAVRRAALSCEEQTWLNSSLHVPPVKQPHMKHIKGLWTQHPVGFLGGGATAGLLGGGVLPGSG